MIFRPDGAAREIHDTVLAGAPAPVGDSLYVATLLPKLKAIGYKHLAIEADGEAREAGHSLDLVRFYESCRRGRCGEEADYPKAKPGWIGLVGNAVEFGYEVHFIDVAPKFRGGFFPRDQELFANLKRDIFDRNRDAKVIVYVGANHVAEYETHNGVYLYKGKRSPLGCFLDAFTGGRNFSVYMEHPWDTPEGCDLFISDFIWNLYQKHRFKPE